MSSGFGFSSWGRFTSLDFSDLFGGTDVDDTTMSDDGTSKTATFEQLRDLMALTTNVRWYGAVGDGSTDDTQAIQDAIDAVSADGGGTVIVDNGTFIFTALVVKENVRFKSLGGILKLKDSVCVSSGTSYYPISNSVGGVGEDNVILDGLIIDGNKANNTQFTVADAITVIGANAQVINCRVYNPPDSGIMFSRVTNGICSGNIITGATDVGIYVNDGDGTGGYENIITNNMISSCKQGGIALKRISQRTIVSENTIYNCGNGITLENASTTSDFSKNVNISNNRIRYIGYIEATAAKRGINLRGSDYTTCVGNRIEDCEGPGIIVEASSYCNISNNIISCEATGSATVNNGIYFTDRLSDGCDYNVVSGNIITNPVLRGIFLGGTVSSQYNIISGNIVKGAGTVGLTVEAVWANNIVRDNSVDGLVDFECFSGAAENIISGNVLKDGTSSGVADQRNRTSILSVFNTTDQKNNIISISVTGIPTTGAWRKEDIVLNFAATEAGIAPNKYVIFGWKRLTTGSGHVSGTDWLELRCLTGN